MSTVYAAVGVLAVLIGTVAVAITTPALSATVPTRITPLGDSITAGPSCWRALLWDRLQQTGYTNIDFVGTQSSGGCTVPFDTDHEGHPGMSATGIASQNLLPGWLSATNPDVGSCTWGPMTCGGTSSRQVRSSRRTARWSTRCGRTTAT
jgi:hypothetical protein